MSVSTIELSDRECGKDCIADDHPVCFGPILHDVHTIDTTQEVPRYHLMKVSGRATSSSGSTFGRNTPNQLDQCSRSHRCGEYNKAQIKAFPTFIDEIGKPPWTDDTADAGTDGKEESDRERSNLEREYLTCGKVGSTRGGRSEEESNHPRQGRFRLLRLCGSNRCSGNLVGRKLRPIAWSSATGPRTCRPRCGRVSLRVCCRWSLLTVRHHVRHEAARFHHAARRRGGGLAAHGAGAAGGDAGGRIS